MCIKCVLADDFRQFYGVLNVPEIAWNHPFFRIFAGFLLCIRYAVSICKKKEIIRFGIKRTVYISINLAGILYSYIANNFNKSSAPKRRNDNSSTMTWSKNFFVLSSFNIVL